MVDLSVSTSRVFAQKRDVTDTVGFWLVLHVALWTLYATISLFPGSIHHDMAEAYVWGREFQLGYYKHPPFWSHVAGLWFMVLPRADWTFYMLSMVNSAVGLWGVWLVGGRFLTGDKRLVALLLLQFLPVFHFLAFKFNANSVFLSIWPFAIYFYLRLVEERKVSMAIALGVICACGLLSKYFFGVLLATFVALTLADARLRLILRNPLPWLSAGICLLLVSPHLAWLFVHDAPPLGYVSGLLRHDWSVIVRRVVIFLGAIVAFHSVMLLVFLALVERPIATLADALSWRSGGPGQRHLLLLTILPPLIAALIALFSGVRLDSNYAIGIIPLTSVIWLMTPSVVLKPGATRLLKKIVFALMAIALGLSPVIGALRFAGPQDGADQPRLEAAREVGALWSEATGAPLRLVAGSWPYANALAFYLPGQVSEFTDLSIASAPWASLDRVSREGIAVLCTATDADCFQRANDMLGAETFHYQIALTRSHLWWRGRTAHLVLLVYPPAEMK